MGNLSLKRLLVLIAIAPLCAFLWLGVSSVYDSYGDYRSLRNQMVVQKLASTGGVIAQVLPAEAFSTPDTMAERRKAVDDTLKALKSAYADWKAAGNVDPAIDAAYAVILEKEPLIKPYRDHVDAGKFDPNEALFVLQPASAAGLELVRRSAATIDDLDLARLIDGFHALMQVNDAGLIEIRLGQSYLGGQALGPGEFGFLFHAKGLRERFQPQFSEFLPSDIVAPFKAFDSSDDGQFVKAALKKMYTEPVQGKDEAGLDRWNKATGARTGLMAGLIAKTGAALSAEAENRLETLHWLFIRGTIIAALVSVAVVALFLFVVSSVSRMIRSIEGRMQRLADGDMQSGIPFIERADEIGGIARSVEVFRQAALRSVEIEASAEDSRRRSELERVEMQRKAEADAEGRLRQATGAFASALHRLAAGDMLCEIHDQLDPQFEELRNDFNVSVAQLRNVLVSVGHAAGAVSGGSGEISHASDNLSKRTEQQAASLEETAAALEEITANVHSTSKRTVEARDLVRDARSRAEHSGVVVGNAVTAMERIEQASRQISQIISVIDEIAFQTNLLALNAGVEAARAGEAGKGFAVVAQEVRELAQRSANAAKEIKSLIGNSELAVSEGVKLVNDTGDGLSTIAALVHQINGHMDAIAAAAQEQSVGLGEVNAAVNHMDQSTQQNAAMVEEMNAASAGLAQEAAGLAALLSQFQTEAASRGGQRSRAA
jgi:methyl-accepting chemotaxis protein